MDLPLSIIIPTFNEEKYLPKLLESIKQQTVSPYEVIVADAKSKDKTREIARSFDCKIVDGGMPAVGRNKGAEVASQKLLLFLDADVSLPANFLENSVKEFQKRKLILATAGAIPIPYNIIHVILFEFVNIWYLFSLRFIPQTYGFCILTTKESHQRIKGFDPTLYLAEDQDYARRMKQFGTLGYLRSTRVYCSTRRLTKDGTIKYMWKYFLINMHLLFRGSIKREIVTYEFGNHK